MRKLAVFHNLPSGGALRVLRDKLKGFKRRGYTVSLYSFSTSERDFMPLDRLADRSHVEPLHFKGFFRYQNYFKATRMVAEVINRSDADLVFVTKCRYFGSPPLLRYLRKPHVFYSHEPLRIRSYEALANGNGAPLAALTGLTPFQMIKKSVKIRDHFIVKREDRRSMRSARLVMTNSHFTARWIKRVYGIEASVNYQGVDADFFCPPEKRERGGHVLSVGRLDETKGHDFILRALAEIPKRARPPFIITCDRLDPRFFKKLQEDADRLGVDCDIRYRVSDEELRTIYQTSRLALCSSVNEPFGLVPLEAMACGTPVLAIKEGGFMETVRDGETGFLLDRDESLWARKIEACLADPAAMKEMGEAGRAEVLRRWTWGPFIERLEKIFSENGQ
jgi:glycosyltransferase involved in cell wall biosynthesis